MPPRLSPGDVVAKHRLVFHLGSGGEAEVWAAVPLGPLRLQRVVAIKVLNPTDDSELEAAFLDEARLLALLDHPAIVPVIDVGVSEHGLYMVMELVKGPTLSMVLRRQAKLRRGMEPGAVAWVGERLAGALHHAWRAPGPGGPPLNIVHRDVSPQNVLIDRWGHVRLSDFGAARSTVQRHRSVVGSIVGKPSYMAPEQARGLAVDNRTDVHAVGVIMYECATSRRLFDPKDPRGIVEVIAQQRPISLDHVVRDFPRSLAAIVDRCLEKDPDRRWPDAGALGEALRAAGAGLGGLDRARDALTSQVNAEFPPEDFEVVPPELPEETAMLRPRSGVWPAAPGVQTDPQLVHGSAFTPAPRAAASSKRTVLASVGLLLVAFVLLGRALYVRPTPSPVVAVDPPPAVPAIQARVSPPKLDTTVESLPGTGTVTSPARTATVTTPAIEPRVAPRRPRPPADAKPTPRPSPLTPSSVLARIARIRTVDAALGSALLAELNELDLEFPDAVARFERRLGDAEAQLKAGRPQLRP